MENTGKTHVFSGNQWKTIGTHTFSLGTYENIRKHWFSVGTNGKHKENSFFLLETIDNIRKHTCFPLEPMENIRKTHVFRRNLGLDSHQDTNKCSDFDLDENGTNVKPY